MPVASIIDLAVLVASSIWFLGKSSLKGCGWLSHQTIRPIVQFISQCSRFIREDTFTHMPHPNQARQQLAPSKYE